MIPGHRNEDCSKVEPLLDDYSRGELPRATADRLVAHLGTCGSCREALDDLRISAKLVGAAFEQVENPGRGFTRLVMARLKVTEQLLQGQGSFLATVRSPGFAHGVLCGLGPRTSVCIQRGNEP